MLAMLLVLGLPATAAYAAVTSKEVEGELMCQCGCTMVVDVCDCETANQIRARIADMIDQGQGKDQIIASFVSQYGDKMLASPPKKGFNLVAWVAPFAAVAVGGVGIFFALRTWVRNGKEEALVETDYGEPLPAAEEEGYRSRLEEELKKFNGEALR